MNNTKRITTEWKESRSHQENWRSQGNISCKDGHNKRQIWYEPAKAEDIKKRWQEYTEELYRKGLSSQSR